jgi:hypothetical protein
VVTISPLDPECAAAAPVVGTVPLVEYAPSPDSKASSTTVAI